LPWLAEHTVGDSVIVPGTAFVELAVRAADQVGCTLVEELTVETPLAVPADTGLQLRVSIGAPEPAGSRSVQIYARPEHALTDGAWTRHATATLTDTAAPAGPVGLTEWPPPDAVEVDVTGLYDGLAAAGLGYGPMFQGLHTAWRRGDDVFAEVS